MVNTPRDTCESTLNTPSALLSTAGARRESRLKRRERGSELIGRVVESELSLVVESEDQQAAFQWERQ